MLVIKKQNIEIEEGLKKTIAYFDKLLKEEYNIIEYTNPLEVATEIAKENDINILIKNLGKYSFLVTDKVKELSRC